MAMGQFCFKSPLEFHPRVKYFNVGCQRCSVRYSYRWLAPCGSQCKGVQGQNNYAWNNGESNQPKCERCVNDHKFSADGIAADPSKVSAITDMPEPTNIAELFHSLDTWPVGCNHSYPICRLVCSLSTCSRNQMLNGLETHPSESEMCSRRWRTCSPQALS